MLKPAPWGVITKAVFWPFSLIRVNMDGTLVSMRIHAHTHTQRLCAKVQTCARCWCHDFSLEVRGALLLPQVYFSLLLLCIHTPCVCMCLCVFLSFDSIWPNRPGPSIQTAGCLFGFALTNTPLGLPSVLRTILVSGLSLAQACCRAHWRSLQANLSPTRTQEDRNHSAPPSHRSEILACFTKARSKEKP